MAKRTSKKSAGSKVNYRRLLRANDHAKDNEVTIRKASVKDLDTIKEYLVDFSILHARGEPNMFSDKMTSPEENANYYKDAVRNRNSRFLIAEKNNEIVGFIKVDFEYLPDIFKYNSVLCVDCIYVAKGFRRNGIAKILMHNIEEIARAEGIKKIIAKRVYNFNKGMHKMLDSIGYTAPYSTREKILED